MRDSQKEGQPVSLGSVRGTKTTKSEDIANTFNDFFTSVATELLALQGLWEDYIPLTPGLPDNDILETPETTSDFISKRVDGMSSKLAAGTEDISVQLLQLAKPAILGHLIFVLDMSLCQGAVPPALKDARVTPIFKYGDKENVNNCRPVSVLPVVRNTLECFLNNHAVPPL